MDFDDSWLKKSGKEFVDKFFSQIFVPGKHLVT
jgi:hypothetical protein